MSVGFKSIEEVGDLSYCLCVVSCIPANDVYLEDTLAYMDDRENVAQQVGALTACFMAQRGFKVDVYERRPDIRKEERVNGRSYNLAISCRANEALKRVGLEEAVRTYGIPMHGRMIHKANGKRCPIPYGNKDQFILSFERRRINEILLTAAEKYGDVNTFFEHKLVSCDFNTGEISLINEKGEPTRSKVDLIIGADGAHSAVRRQMMKVTGFDYQQEYISHGYIELTIPPNIKNEFAMERSYLHIWPRDDFMMIALPNQNKSFTTNLYMPFQMFHSIKGTDAILKFFKEKFPDSVPLLGEKELVATYKACKTSSMMYVKCRPYHVNDTAVIIGDAAHAMVPFYGQGMNCGFEDCLVLNALLDKYDNDFAKVLPEFSRTRNVDAEAICDLSMDNYIEMRSSVNTRLFYARKKLDNFLYRLFPNTWVPLYTMVAFTQTPYRECVARRTWQNKIISRCVPLSILLTGCLIVGVARSLHRHGLCHTWPWMAGLSKLRLVY